MTQARARAAGDYFNRANPDLLALIPPDAGAVLELGCGAGALCEAYRRRNPDVEWHGYEIDPGAAAKAEGRGVHVVRMDLDRAPMGFYSDDVPECDVHIWGDVLEHLKDPWAALGQRMMWLRPGGLVLACVPNIGHHTNIMKMIRGEWRYEDEGLLDRTHLRWWDLGGVKELFRSAGLDVFEVRARQCGHDPQAWDELKRWINDEADVDAAVDAFWKRARCFQWVVRARKPHAWIEVGGCEPDGRPLPGEMKGLYPGYDRPLRLHAVFERSPFNGTVCERPRVLEPFAALATIPGVRCTTHVSGGGTGGAGPEPDIVIQQRAMGVDADSQRLIAGNHLLIAEWDDDPRAFRPVVDSDFLPLRSVHAVQVSTAPLADLVRRWNPNVFVVPNQLAEIPPLRPARDGKGIVLFFGAIGREKDWGPIMPALLGVLKDHRDVSACVIHDQLFADTLREAGVPVQFRPFCSYDDYRRTLRGCDIALLPLEDTEFNACKSDVKFLECAAEGVAILASHVAYGHTLRETRKLGSLAAEFYGSPVGLELALSFMIENPGHRRDLSEFAYAYVRDRRMLRHHYRATHATYLDLLGRKAELDASLAGRMSGSGMVHAAKTPEKQVV